VPNIALMRIAAHRRDRGDEVELQRTEQPETTVAQMKFLITVTASWESNCVRSNWQYI